MTMRNSEAFHRLGEVPKNLGEIEREGFERVLLFIHTLGYLLEEKGMDVFPLTSTDMHRLFPQFSLMMRWEGSMYTLDPLGLCRAVNVYFGNQDKDVTTEYAVNPFVQHILKPEKIEGLAKQRLIEAGESVFKLWLP